MGHFQGGRTYMGNAWANLPWSSLLFSLTLLTRAIAQDTNVYPVEPATRLESFATNTDTIVIRGSADIGVVNANAGTIVLKCREVSEAGNGRKEVGISVDLNHNELRETRYIDFDELEPLINALAYLNKVDWSITSLNSFDAAITTRSGLRASAFSSRRSAAIEFAVRTAGSGNPPILVSREQLAEFRGLLEQAKTKLDGIRSK